MRRSSAFAVRGVLAGMLIALLPLRAVSADPRSAELAKIEARLLACQKEGVKIAAELFGGRSNIDPLLEQYKGAADERTRYLAFTGIQVYVAQRLLNYPEDVAGRSKEKAELRKTFECHDAEEERRRTLTDDNG